MKIHHCLLSKSNIFDQNLTKLGHFVKYHDVFKFDNGPYRTMLSVVNRPCSPDGNVSGYRCVSDCRSRGREFDPNTVPYFHGD